MAIPNCKKFNDVARLYMETKTITIPQLTYTIPFSIIDIKSNTNNVFSLDNNKLIIHKYRWYQIDCMLQIKNCDKGNARLYLYKNGDMVRQVYIPNKTNNVETDWNTVQLNAAFQMTLNDNISFVLGDCKDVSLYTGIFATNVTVKEL